MPTVLRLSGLKFEIYFKDHEPAHVHVIKGRTQAKINIGGVDPVVVRVAGMAPVYVKEAFRIVTERQSFFQAEWARIASQ
jgi:hypothetical protein